MELDIIRAVQSCANPVLDWIFECFSILGESAVLIPIFGWIYWNTDKEFGLRLGYTMAVSLLLNGAIKDLVRAPRPIGEEGVRSLRVHTATGYSFPSGHSQSSASFYPAFAAYFSRPWVRLLLWLLPLAVGLSRIYLGVHYPRDVLAGLALGYLSALLLPRLLSQARRPVLVMALSGAVFIPFLFLSGRSHDFYTAFGCMAGLVAAVAFEKKYVRFSPALQPTDCLRRYIPGLILLGTCAIVLKALLPDGDLFTVLRYALLIFLGAGAYPWLFTRLEQRKKRRSSLL